MISITCMPYKDPEVARLAAKQRRKSNPEKHRAINTRFSKTLNGKFSTVKSKARYRNIEFSLSLEEFLELHTSAHCHYCGGELPPSGHGLDRKDSTRGYFKENLVTCCSECNRIKSDKHSYEEMLAIAAVLRKFKFQV